MKMYVLLEPKLGPQQFVTYSHVCYVIFLKTSSNTALQPKEQVMCVRQLIEEEKSPFEWQLKYFERALARWLSWVK